MAASLSTLTQLQSMIPLLSTRYRCAYICLETSFLVVLKESYSWVISRRRGPTSGRWVPRNVGLWGLGRESRLITERLHMKRQSTTRSTRSRDVHIQTTIRTRWGICLRRSNLQPAWSPESSPTTQCCPSRANDTNVGSPAVPSAVDLHEHRNTKSEWE
jgi:hypothetical protein